MTLKEVQDYAASLVKDLKYKDGVTQEDIAKELGMTQGNLSSALNKASTRWLGTQRRIIEAYSPYSIEKRVEYVVVRRPAGEGE